MSAAQTNYSRILLQFNRINYNEDSQLRDYELKQALDSICQKNAGINEFNPEVAEELWSETDKNNDGSVSLRSFISVVVRAQSILKENIAKAESELSSGVSDDERRRDLQASLSQYDEDLKLLSLPFQISVPADSRRSNIKLNASMSRVSHLNPNQSGLENSGMFSGRSSGVFADVPSKRESSGSLKWTFIITVFLFALELIICFHKNHFYNTLVYLMIFSIVILGYFDRYYMKFVLLNLVISIVLDLVWVIAQASVPLSRLSPSGTPNPPRTTRPSRPPSSASYTSSSSSS